jgi:hypothetical protein
MGNSHRSQRGRHLCPADLPVFGQADEICFPVESCIFIIPSYRGSAAKLASYYVLFRNTRSLINFVEYCTKVGVMTQSIAKKTRSDNPAI